MRDPPENKPLPHWQTSQDLEPPPRPATQTQMCFAVQRVLVRIHVPSQNRSPGTHQRRAVHHL